MTDAELIEQHAMVINALRAIQTWAHACDEGGPISQDDMVRMTRTLTDTLLCSMGYDVQTTRTNARHI